MKLIAFAAVAACALAGCSPVDQQAANAPSFASSNIQVATRTGIANLPVSRPHAEAVARPGVLVDARPEEERIDEDEAAATETTFRAPSSAPLPPRRPDFEGEDIKSRSIGAVVADADKVDRELERKAAPPQPVRVAMQPATPVTSLVPTSSTMRPQATLVGAGVVATPIASTGPRVQLASLEPNVSAGRMPSLAGMPAVSGSQGYYAAYPDVVMSCFPPDLREALNIISAHYGQPVQVTSGFRNHGRAHSQHRYCKAADIRVDGVGPQALAAYAKTVPHVMGVGTYRYNTVTHVDVRETPMAWRY